MKRYWLFEAQQYYPSGGMLDWIGDYDSVEEAEEARTVKFNPDVPYRDIEAEWKSIITDTPKEQQAQVTRHYRNMQVAQAQEWQKRDTGYHILDTHERVIVRGWDQYEEKVIEKQTLAKFKEDN